MAGIENIKNALKVVIDIGEAVDNALKDDGKISFTEGAGIAFKAVKVWGVIKDYPDIAVEFADLDAEERAELTAWVKEELDITNDKAEEIIETAVEILLSITEFLDVIHEPTEVG